MYSAGIRHALALLFAMAIALASRAVYAQSFGVELHNTLMPAAGGMGGVSIAQPQDLTSALNANPATLTQFAGTQFLLGGAWAEQTVDLRQSGVPALSRYSSVGGNVNISILDNVIDPFSAKSTAPGIAAGNVGVTKSLSEFGLPATVGIGGITTVSNSVDFRHVPQSGGTDWGLAVTNVPVSLGVEITDRCSVGATLSLGTARFDGPFTSNGGMTTDYALRGTVGMNYKTSDFTKVGAYYQSGQSFRFDNALVGQPGAGQYTLDVALALPHNFGLGIANAAALDGRLLLAVDLLYKLWDQADFFHFINNDQLVIQFGAQYSTGPYRLRAGYVWADNAIRDIPDPNSIGSHSSWREYALERYVQGVVAATGQHRISAGLGIVDVLPGMNFDLMAGGSFRDRSEAEFAGYRDATDELLGKQPEPLTVPLMALGVVAFAAPASWGHWLMAAGFGGLHIIFGAIIARKHGG
jgi:long-chain fatty acid transport protein